MKTEGLEKIRNLIIAALQEAQQEDMEKLTQKIVWIIVLTILPILVYVLGWKFEDRYFGLFSGRLMYISPEYYFGFSPTFVLDLPFFLPPLLWAGAVWLCLKTRKQITDRKSFQNYAVLILLTLNSVFFLYSAWFVLSLLA